MRDSVSVIKGSGVGVGGSVGIGIGVAVGAIAVRAATTADSRVAVAGASEIAAGPPTFSTPKPSANSDDGQQQSQEPENRSPFHLPPAALRQARRRRDGDVFLRSARSIDLRFAVSRRSVKRHG